MRSNMKLSRFGTGWRVQSVVGTTRNFSGRPRSSLPGSSCPESFFMPWYPLPAWSSTVYFICDTALLQTSGVALKGQGGVFPVLMTPGKTLPLCMPRRRVDPVHFEEYCLMLCVIAAIQGFLSGVVPGLGGSCTYFLRSEWDGSRGADGSLISLCWPPITDLARPSTHVTGFILSDPDIITVSEYRLMV